MFLHINRNNLHEIQKSSHWVMNEKTNKLIAAKRVRKNCQEEVKQGGSVLEEGKKEGGDQNTF